MLRVGGVGSQCYKKLEYVSQFLEALPKSEVILVSGGARGVDCAFAGSGGGRWKGFETDVYPVPKGTPREDFRAAAFARNKIIASQSQVIVAFWDGQSNGTANTIAHAAVLGRPVYVVGPHREGFDEAVAGVLGRLNAARSRPAANDSEWQLGPLVRAMPCGHRIHRLASATKPGESEFVIYDRTGEVVSFSQDPVVAFTSAFAKYSKELYEHDRNINDGAGAQAAGESEASPRAVFESGRGLQERGSSGA